MQLDPAISLSFNAHAPHPDLHSFPTRRSSDLRPSPPPCTSGSAPGAGRCWTSACSTASSVSSATTSPCPRLDRKSTRLNSSHQIISYAVFCLKKKTEKESKHEGSEHDHVHAPQ